MSNMLIEDRVAQAIKKRPNHISLRACAAEMGVDPATLCRWLNGTQKPSLMTLNRALKWTGIKVHK